MSQVLENSAPNASGKSLRPNNFDLIRLIAAIQVVIVHGVEHLALRDGVNGYLWFWVNAFPGVPIFFVISGFLISRSWERDSYIKPYTINRFLRIYPALFFCFLLSVVSILIAAPSLIFEANYVELVMWCLSQLTFVQFFNPTFLRPYGVGVVNGSLWTIPVELQFYIALPVVYWALGLRNAKRNSELLGLILVFLLFAVLYAELLPRILPGIALKFVGVTMLPYFWMFLLGVIAQRNWAAISPYIENRLPFWVLAYIVSVFIFSNLGMTATGNGQFPILTLVLAGLVLSVAFSFRGVSEYVLRGNDISYGVYIYHMVVINFVLSYGVGREWTSLLLVLLVTVALAIVSWTQVERIALRLKFGR
ncbi:MAG: acyltransferase [Planctomycetaceae bacterium]|nr:acyltransferase [Planctomycetaceae bacterium]